MRLRRGRQQRTAGFHFADRKPDDGGDGDLDADQVVPDAYTDTSTCTLVARPQEA